MDGETDGDAYAWSSAPPGPDHDSDDDVASWPSIYSIMAQGTLIERVSWVTMVPLAQAFCIELPMPNIYPGSGSGFNRIQMRFLWVPPSVSIMGHFQS